MKHFKYLLITFLFSLITFGSLQAQENERSQVIKWENGKKYYIHTVTKGQGLFTIERLYGVQEKDILENNPEVFDGLKVGQQLKIPFVKTLQSNSKYKIHIIEKGQTIYSISKIYKVAVNEIFALNPELKNGYKIDQKIKIPIKKQEEKSEEQAQNKSKNKIYKVKKKDTLYGLSKKFKLSTEQILNANPQIKKDGLRKGQKIIIPKEEKVIEEALYMPVDTFKYSDSSLLDLNGTCDTTLALHRTKPINIAVLLPFSVNIDAFNEELESEKNNIPQFKKKPFFEFYQGLLLAIKNLKSKGYKINLHVFDTKNNPAILTEILKKPHFNETELIIGPVYKNSFNLAQKYADSLHIPIINPIVKTSHFSDKSSYVIDIFPSNKLMLKQSVKLIPLIDSSDFYIIHSGFVQDKLKAIQFKKDLKQHLKALGKDTNFVFKELIFTENKIKGLAEKLNKNKKNFIIITSDNQPFVSNIVTNLNFLAEDYDITLLGLPTWKKFNNIDLRYFHRLNLLQISNEYVDYHKEEVQEFVKNYREYYSQEPNRYAFIAYDISRFFIPYFYAQQSFSCLNQFKNHSLMLDFSFIKNKKGMINNSIDILHYNKNFDIEKVYTIKNEIQQ